MKIVGNTPAKQTENKELGITSLIRKYCNIVQYSTVQYGTVQYNTVQYSTVQFLILVFTTDNGGSVGHSASNAPLRGTKGTLWEGGTRAVTFLHSPLLERREGDLLDGLFHIVDWTPTLASIAGVEEERIAQLKLDGKNQKDFILNQGKSVRSEFVYNIKTVPFKVRVVMSETFH